MKLRHKYLNPIVIYLCVYIFGLWLFGFSLNAVNGIYTYLNHLMPNIFPVYNPIYNPDEYAELEKNFTVIALFVALFLINFIALKLDNKKYERVISETDGQYLMRDGIKLYFKEFFVSDIISALILPALLVIPPYFISDDALGYFGLIIVTWLGYQLKYIYALVPAVITVALFSFAGRLLAISGCVKSWRAAWLSDI